MSCSSVFTCLHRAWQVPALLKRNEGQCNTNEKNKKYEDNYKDEVDNNNDGNGCDQCCLVTNGGIMDMIQ